MKIKLYSDFIDYYDHHFDASGKRFERFSTGGINRIEMFKFLESHGYETPKHGKVKEISEIYPDRWVGFAKGMSCDEPSYIPEFDTWKFIEVVVYTDINSHRGEGKIKMCLDEAIEKYPNNFASIYIFNWATSYRHLQIGEKSFWLRYCNRGDWRSNCGNVRINILSQNTGYHKSIKYPLFAIDFVSQTDPDFYLKFKGQKKDEREDTYSAIDFNISPGIGQTGIEEILKPDEVVELIKKFYKDN